MKRIIKSSRPFHLTIILSLLRMFSAVSLYVILREYMLANHLEYDIVHKHINYAIADVILLILSFWDFGLLDYTVLHSSLYRLPFSIVAFILPISVIYFLKPSPLPLNNYTQYYDYCCAYEESLNQKPCKFITNSLVCKTFDIFNGFYSKPNTNMPPILTIISISFQFVLSVIILSKSFPTISDNLQYPSYISTIVLSVISICFNIYLYINKTFSYFSTTFYILLYLLPIVLIFTKQMMFRFIPVIKSYREYIIFILPVAVYVIVLLLIDQQQLPKKFISCCLENSNSKTCNIIKKMDICESYSVFEEKMLKNANEINVYLYIITGIVIFTQIYEIYKLINKNRYDKEKK